MRDGGDVVGRCRGSADSVRGRGEGNSGVLGRLLGLEALVLGDSQSLHCFCTRTPQGFLWGLVPVGDDEARRKRVPEEVDGRGGACPPASGGRGCQGAGWGIASRISISFSA